MRITSRGFTAVTVGLVSAVLLPGCSGDSTKPTVLPTLPSSSSAPTTTPSPTAAVTTSVPAPPSAASVTTKPSLAATNKEIEKAVREYYAANADAIAKESSLPLMKSRFAETCRQCATDYANYKRLHDKKWSAKGGYYQILSVKANAQNSVAGSATIDFTVKADEITDATGHIVERNAAQPKQSAGLTLVKHAGTWVIVGFIDFGDVN